MRVKTGVIRHRKHRKILKLAKGYWMSRHKLYKKAKEAVLHAGAYAYHGRKLRKRNFRTLWIQRLNAALHLEGITYSHFIHQLKADRIELDRRIMAELAIDHPQIFKELVHATFKSQKPGAGAN